MPEPELYKHYDRSEAIALVGSGLDPQILCDGQWVIWPNAALCLTDIGDPPRMSHFNRGSEFCWVADKPYTVSGARYTAFVPSEVVGSAGRARAIKLFVRQAGSKKYLFLGTLGPSYRQRAAGKENFGQAHFDLLPTLPSHLWEEIGGFKAGNLDHAAVDSALDRLRGHTTTEDRLEILRRLVEYWHEPIGPNDGFTEEELRDVRIPESLRWWYRWAGRRTAIVSGQNHLLSPAGEGPFRLRGDKDHLLFYVENQFCYQWATFFEGDDPQVFGRYRKDDPWESESMTLSEHLILACLFEAIMCHSRYGASAAWLTERKFRKVATAMTAIAIHPWRWPGSARNPRSTQFFARSGAFMLAAGNDTPEGRAGYSVWLGAKTEQPLEFLKPLLDQGWEYTSV